MSPEQLQQINEQRRKIRRAENNSLIVISSLSMFMCILKVCTMPLSDPQTEAWMVVMFFLTAIISFALIVREP